MALQKDRHCKNWLLGVRLTPLATTFSILMEKEQHLQGVNTFNQVLVT